MENIEQPEEKGPESLSEYQKEILESVGIENIAELNSTIEDLEGEERRDGEDDGKYQERQNAVKYFKEVLKQLYE